MSDGRRILAAIAVLALSAGCENYRILSLTNQPGIVARQEEQLPVPKVDPPVIRVSFVGEGSIVLGTDLMRSLSDTGVRKLLRSEIQSFPSLSRASFDAKEAPYALSLTVTSIDRYNKLAYGLYLASMNLWPFERKITVHITAKVRKGTLLLKQYEAEQTAQLRAGLFDLPAMGGWRAPKVEPSKPLVHDLLLQIERDAPELFKPAEQARGQRTMDHRPWTMDNEKTVT